MRQIIRYKNRKLYDPIGHEYISLQDILYLVKYGDEFAVVERHTGKNVTYKVLASALQKAVRPCDSEALKYFIWNELEID